MPLTAPTLPTVCASSPPTPSVSSVAQGEHLLTTQELESSCPAMTWTIVPSLALPSSVESRAFHSELLPFEEMIPGKEIIVAKESKTNFHEQDSEASREKKAETSLRSASAALSPSHRLDSTSQRLQQQHADAQRRKLTGAITASRVEYGESGKYCGI